MPGLATRLLLDWWGPLNTAFPTYSFQAMRNRACELTFFVNRALCRSPREIISIRRFQVSNLPTPRLYILGLRWHRVASQSAPSISNSAKVHLSNISELFGRSLSRWKSGVFLCQLVRKQLLHSSDNIFGVTSQVMDYVLYANLL
jgi:hypothetical protein